MERRGLGAFIEYWFVNRLKNPLYSRSDYKGFFITL